MDKHKAATIHDVASMAGVSVSTVSRVLTGNARVKSEKVDRIQTAILKLNYNPNLAARNLQSSESKALGVILPDISNPFFSEFFVELERIAFSAGYSVFLCNTMNNTDPLLGDLESLYLRSLSARQVDGIFFMGGRINRAENLAGQLEEMNQLARRIPLILINGRMNNFDGYMLQTDEEGGFSGLMEYVIGRGHRRIALIGGTKGVLPADLKFRLFRKILKQHQIPVNEDWICYGSFSAESGEQLASRVLDLPEKPDVLICINDLVALGAKKAAELRGLRIPEELGICGFDGIATSKLVFPQLTTVNHHFPGMAEKAMELFLRLKEGKSVTKRSLLSMELIPGGTLGTGLE